MFLLRCKKSRRKTDKTADVVLGHGSLPAREKEAKSMEKPKTNKWRNSRESITFNGITGREA